MRDREAVYGIKVALVAETACFRDPGGQLYHATLPLPPVSTIVGLAGAALGLSFDRVWGWFRQNQVSVGVNGTPFGKGKDLWNYTKRTVDLEKNPRTDILNREFLCFAPRFMQEQSDSGSVNIYYACEDHISARQLYEAFLEPVFALTLGSSDDLAKCKSVKWFDNLSAVTTSELQDVMVEGDWSQQFTFDFEAIKKAPLSVSLSAPKVKRLPVDYSFDESGVRKAVRYESFTFLSNIQRLKEQVPAYCYGEEQIPLSAIR